MEKIKIKNKLITFTNEKLHPDYGPFKYSFDDFILIFFGIFFEDKWLKILKKVVKKNYNKNNNEIVKEIQLKVDGDYSIIIFHKPSNSFIGFTDILGRLPVYFFEKRSQNKLHFSLSPPINNLDEMILDHDATIDFLIFGFSLGNSTIFKSIKKLNCFKYIFFDGEEIELIDMNWPNWWTKSDDTSLNFLLQNIEKYNNKIKNFLKKENEVIVDLSGGFDSRLVHTLFKDQRNVLYVTQKYVQNEYLISKKLTNNKAEHHFLNTKHDINDNELSKILFLTDGLVNPYTTNICYKEQKEYLKVSKAKYRLMGFGGEFLRKPIKPLLLMNNVIKSRFDFHPKKLNINNKLLRTYLSKRSRKLQRTQDLKQFYFMYYLHLVVHAGEHRSRIDHVTIQPLFSKEIIAFFFNSNNSSFVLFYKILKSLGADLSVPIYKVGHYTHFKALKLDLIKFLSDHTLAIRKKFVPIWASRIITRKKHTKKVSIKNPHKLIKPLLNNSEFDKDFYANSYTDRLLGLNLFLHSIDEHKQ